MWCSTRLNTWATIISYLYKWSSGSIKYFRLNYVCRWYKSFLFHQNINDLFSTVNSELGCINQWFKANKFWLNIEKTKYTLFHKKSAKNEISGIHDLKIGSKNIEKTSSTKFIGVMLDKHISWNNRIKTVENKLAKNIGLLDRAS